MIRIADLLLVPFYTHTKSTIIMASEKKKQYNREYMRKLRAEPEYERGDLYDLCPICKCTYWLSNWSRHQKTKKHQQLDSPPTEEALLIRNKSGATPF